MTPRKSISYAVALLMVAPAFVSFPTSGWTQIEEIIVTTRKREENLQQIPIAVNVLSAEDIVRLNILDVTDVARFSSSVIFNPGFFPNDNKIIIRGLRNTRGRPSAAFLIDGIDITSQSISQRGNSLLATTRLLDVERVEVVMGPQPALYGRSAFGGAIQYITKDPADEFEVHMNADVGSDSRYNVNGGLSGPVIEDVLGLRLNATWWDKEGFYQELLTGSDIGGGDGWGLAGTGKLHLGERWSFKARLEYSSDNFDEIARVLLLDNTWLNGSVGCRTAPDGTVSSAFRSQGGRAPGAVCSGSSNPYFFGTVPDNAGDRQSDIASPDPLTGQPYQGSWRDLGRFSLVSEWELDFGTFTAWTGFTDADSGFIKDGGNGSIPGLIGGVMTDTVQRGQRSDSQTDTQQFSQEIRFASAWDDSPVQLAVGALYFNEEVDRVSENISMAVCSPGPDSDPPDTTSPCFDAALGRALTSQETMPNVIVNPSPISRELEAWSVYGLVEWQFFDKWKFTAEARYSDETETTFGWDCDGARMQAQLAADLAAGLGDTLGFGGACPRGPSSVSPNLVNQAIGMGREDQHDETFLTPRFALEWTPTEDTLIYLSAGKAVKPGGINVVVSGTWSDLDFDGDVDENEFGKETLWAYELGTKKTWLDGTLRTNGAVFFQDYEGRQVSTQQPDCCGSSTSKILNAGVSEIYGVEIDTLWQATDNLTLSVGYTYLDATYKEFINPFSDSGGTNREANNCKPIDADGDGDFDFCEISFSGNELEGIPKHSFVGQAGYRRGLNSSLDWLIEGDIIYLGDRWQDEFNQIELKSYTLVNLRLGLAAEKWEVLAYVDNLFDEDTVQQAEDVSSGINRERIMREIHEIPIPAGAGPGDFRISGAPSPTGSAMAFLPDPRTYGVRFSFRY